jgi:hypothetical protein
VDPYDSDAIAQAIERLSFDRGHYAARRSALEKASVRSWNDFALDLIKAMNLKIDGAYVNAAFAKQSGNRKHKH